MTGPGSHLLRDDLDVPVMIVNSEIEAITCYRVRQPDTERFRWWEVAGTSHGSAPGARMMSRRTERDKVGIAVPIIEGINPVSTTPVVDAAVRHMRSWAVGGPAPPIQPRIEFAGDPPDVVRDEDGIAKGGIRLPQIDVPIACDTSTPIGDGYGMLGSHQPFPTDELRSAVRRPRRATSPVSSRPRRPPSMPACSCRGSANDCLPRPRRSGSDRTMTASRDPLIESS